MKRAVILGGGITGLFTGYFLTKHGWNVTLLERNPRVGGMCSSFKKDDLTLDFGPHKIYTTIPGVMKEFRDLLQSDFLTIKKRNALYLFGNQLDFPPKIMQMVMKIPWWVGFRSGVSFAWSNMKSLFNRKPAVSYEDYFLKGFGAYGYSILFRDYAKKIWGDPNTLSEELARKRIPIPSVGEFVKNIFVKTPNPEVSANEFYYPKHGFGSMCDLLARKITEGGGQIIVNANVDKIVTGTGKVESVHCTVGGKTNTLTADVFLSTVHITDIPTLFQPNLSEASKHAAKSLSHRALILAYFVFDARRLMPYNWVFYPGKDIVFNRVSEQKSFSDYMMPHTKTVIIAEVTATPGDETWNMDEAHFLARVHQDLKKVGVCGEAKVLDSFTKRARRVYPVYSVGFKEHINTVKANLEQFPNFYTFGRQGLFNYNNSDHCLDMAKVLSNFLQKGGSRKEWNDIMDYFDSYKIVD